jgi:hypothetical protein
VPARLWKSALAALAVALLVPAAAQAATPRSFLGVLADGPLLDPRIDLRGELQAMSQAGVGAMRFTVDWSAAQPYPDPAAVPAQDAGRFTAVEDGVPTDWSASDRLVAAATERRIALLPVVMRAPAWARLRPERDNSPPSDAGGEAYARYLAALVRRYGPQGSFWAANPQLPRLPVRQWQVWNEPAGSRDWSEQPGLPRYVALLRRAHDALKAADPGAQVVLGGLVGRSWEQLAQVYRLGGRRYFDVAAIHPFSRYVTNVVLIVRLARTVMRRHGDGRKPLVLSELSWPSAKGKTSVRYGFEETERGQARRLREAVLALAARPRALRIRALYWSSWISYDRDPRSSFDYAGLRRFHAGRVVAKPAFYAFRRVARRLER